MAGIIAATVIGNLGKDPEVKFDSKGGAICNFSVAVSTKTKDGEVTTWVRVSAFGKTGEIAGKFLAKGKQVACSGRMMLREYTSNGKQGVSLDMVANDVTLLGKRDDEAPAQSKPAATLGSDDIPF